MNGDHLFPWATSRHRVTIALVRELSRSRSRLYTAQIERSASRNCWKSVVKFANQITVPQRCLLHNVNANW